jgi:hypothetical protein
MKYLHHTFHNIQLQLQVLHRILKGYGSAIWTLIFNISEP